MEAQMEDGMFVGRRKPAGVELPHFGEKFGTPLEQVYGDLLEKEQAKGNLAVEQGYVKLTEKGRFVGNEVFEQFLLS